jgi:hypothetical protein
MMLFTKTTKKVNNYQYPAMYAHFIRIFFVTGQSAKLKRTKSP